MMLDDKDVQFRGHCQGCGRLQAVMGQELAHHGYEVKDGWFQGKCGGHAYLPVEQDRTQLDSTCRQVTAQAAELDDYAAKLQAGTVDPVTADSGNRDRRGNEEQIPYAEASKYNQDRARRAAIFSTERKARMARDFVRSMQRLAEVCHGKPLVKAIKPEAPEPIVVGEQRQFTATDPVLTALSIERGGRVRYSYTNSAGKTFTTSTTTRSWRSMAKAGQAPAELEKKARKKVDPVVDAINDAITLLDSVAFVAEDGDTAGPLEKLRYALRVIEEKAKK